MNQEKKKKNIVESVYGIFCNCLPLFGDCNNMEIIRLTSEVFSLGQISGNDIWHSPNNAVYPQGPWHYKG